MTHRELFLYFTTLGVELLLCVLVYLRKLQQRLFFFSAYSALLLACTLGMPLVYRQFGFRSSVAYNAFWLTTGLVMIARGFAVAELCRYELRAYQGIWALSWRILTVVAIFFLAHAAVDAWGQVGGIAIWGLTIERDIAISAIVVVVGLLLIRKYYGIILEPLHMYIALGICLVSIVDVMNNTMLRDVFTGRLMYWFFGRYAPTWSVLRSQVEHANDLWNLVRTSGLVASIGVWCYALRKPLPAPAARPVLLPAEVYATLSPAINLRLRAFNNRLEGMLKP